MVGLATRLDRTFLLRAGVTLAVLVAVETAMVLYRIPGGVIAGGAALYLSLLLGGLFTVPERGSADVPGAVLDAPTGVAAFLLAPLPAVAALGVLAVPFSLGALDLHAAVAVFGAAMGLIVALLLVTMLVPAEGWSAEGGVLAEVAARAERLLGTLFRPGVVAAAGFVVGSLIVG